MKFLHKKLTFTGKFLPTPRDGNILEIGLNKKLTKFNIKEILFSQRSKKLRSNSIDVRTGGNLSYRIVGKILKIKGANILIRNIIDLQAFEIHIPVLSPLIKYLFIQQKISKRNNSFYLRHTNPYKSKVVFNYASNDL